MKPVRMSFWARFALTLSVFAACGFCLYYVEAVVFSAPAPVPPAYDIAPQLSAAEGKAVRAQARQSAAELAAQQQKRGHLAAAGGLKEGDAIYPFFAKADMERGRRVFARCAACHSGARDGGSRVGPPLWGIIGRQVAGHQGFSYSAALKAYAEKQKNWDLAALDRFLYAPGKAVPGTIMFYPGVKDLQERADLLREMESLSDSAP